MACDGYEHDQRVVTVERIEEHGVPKVTVGIIVEVHRERHRMDVLFANVGRLNNLDPHSFRPETEQGTPPQAVSAAR